MAGGWGAIAVVVVVVVVVVAVVVDDDDDVERLAGNCGVDNPTGNEVTVVDDVLVLV